MKKKKFPSKPVGGYLSGQGCCPKGGQQEKRGYFSRDRKSRRKLFGLRLRKKKKRRKDLPSGKFGPTLGKRGNIKKSFKIEKRKLSRRLHQRKLV